jgi:hypothetical protein
MKTANGHHQETTVATENSNCKVLVELILA